MGQISLSIPTNGLPRSTEEPKVANDLTLIQNVINGNLDATNISATLAQSAGVNQVGQVSKGVTVNTGPGTRTNVAYGALSDAADQVTGIVLPANGWIKVGYMALWQSTVSATAAAAIFLNANQLKVGVGTGPVIPQQATMAAGTINSDAPLFSTQYGLDQSSPGVVAATQVTTGQVVGNTQVAGGGAVCIFAAAGTYTVSVQFKASSGTVTASQRKLWVKAESFA